MSIFDPKHEHEVNDLDGYFIIDPITRSITNTTEAKTALMQYDHNSEIFSFAIPRYVEDHDMTISDAVQIHYINSSDTEKQPGLYMVTDMRINDSGEEEMVVFSWIISQQAIGLKGSLQFQIKFICYDSEGSGTPSYIWSTKVFSAINVLPGLNNAEVVVTEYPDILTQLSSEIDRVNDKVNKLSQEGGGAVSFEEVFENEIDDLSGVLGTNFYKVLPLPTIGSFDHSYFMINSMDERIGIIAATCFQMRFKETIEVRIYDHETSSWGEWAELTGDVDLSGYYTSKEADEKFESKVDKIEGYGLSNVVNVYINEDVDSTFNKPTHTIVIDTHSEIDESGSTSQEVAVYDTDTVNELIDTRLGISVTEDLSSTEDILMLENVQEAYLGTVESITMRMPDMYNRFDYHQSYFTFEIGDIEDMSTFSITCLFEDSGEQVDIVWVGDDCNAEGVFTPQANTRYEVHLKCMSIPYPNATWVARVGAY